MIAFAFTPAAIKNRSEGVARLVQADRLKAGTLPGDLRARRQTFDVTNGVSVEAEDDPLVAMLKRLVRNENVAEGANDRNGSAAGAALRLDVDSALVVVGALDTDDAVARSTSSQRSAMSSPRRRPA